MNKTYGRLPLSFEANQGQTDARVRFLSRNNGYNLFLTADEAVLSIQASAGRDATDEAASSSDSRGGAIGVLRMKLLGASRHSRVAGIDQLPGKSNYFRGADPKNWRRNVPSYGRVKYEAIYPGVDLLYYGNQRQLEYDFIVSPGADPNRITLGFSGASGVRIEENGDLILRPAGEEIRQLAPNAYQEIDGVRKTVECRYQLHNNLVRFELGSYDRSRTLVIDPLLDYSTYLGGAFADAGNSIAVGNESSGSYAYITGQTRSVDFPTTAGAFQRTYAGTQNDVFVTKLNQDGSGIVYSTYIGGSANDIGYSIAVDGSGQAFVAGATESADFPTTPSAYQQTLPGGRSAFLVKLQSAGDGLAFSTFLGGQVDQEAYGVALNGPNAYVAGRTASPDFPITVGAYQTSCNGGVNCDSGFVSRFDASGSYLVYSTYVGVFSSTRIKGIAVDSTGSAYVAGFTGPGNQGQDGFVTRLSPAGSAIYISMLGGDDIDACNAIAVDSAGNAYVTGETKSFNYPSTFREHIFGMRLGYNAFVTKLDAFGRIAYSKFIEGDGDDRGYAIAVDADGRAYVAGSTTSANLPISADALQNCFEGAAADAFLTKLSPSGETLEYSTYWGGAGEDAANGVAIDAVNNLYATGITYSSDLPATTGAFRSSIGGSSDAFVLKIGMGQQSFSVSGQVTNNLNNPLIAVAVSLSGTFNRTVHTNAIGVYSIGGLAPGGHFTLSAQRGSFVFSPSSFEFPSLTQNETLNFSGPAPLVISGDLKDTAGNPISTSVSISGGATATVQSDQLGHFAFNDLVQGGNYTVTPSSGLYAFEPASQSVTSLSGDATLYFSTLPLLKISGQVTDGFGNGINAITVALSGDASQTTQTDFQGRYNFYNVARGGNYTVTPSSTYYTFEPASQSVSNASANQTFNFVALPPLSIYGRVTNEWGYAAAEGVTITLSGTINDTRVTDYNGNYGFYEVPRGGTYTVTPSHPLLNFTPDSQTFTNMDSPQELNFAATYKRYTISGRVTDLGGAGINAVTISLSGWPATQTDAGGNYTISGLVAGRSFTVTPSKAGLLFDPANYSTEDLRDDQTANFTGRPEFATISGRVTGSGGAGLAGVTVTLGGAQSATVQTDAQGNYSFVVPTAATYSVTPSKANYSFSPVSQSFNNLVADQTANFTGAQLTVIVSGRITDTGGAGLAATVTLSGSQSGSTQADAQGNYSFASLPSGGSYTVTPSLTHYSFNPGSQSFTNAVTNQTANFTGTRLTHTINGRVSDSSGTGLAATVNLSGSQPASTQTDSSGYYSFASLLSGADYTVTPSLANFGFTPPSRTFTNLSANQAADFTGARLTFTISGRITDSAGAGLNNITLHLTGTQDVWSSTDAQGNYVISGVLAGGDYTVTASNPNYSFSPATRSFTNLSANQTADFTGTRLTFTVSGQITNGASGVGGATVTLGGAQSASAQTDANGNYSYANLSAGLNYTVTPSKTHYVFSPASANVNNLSANTTVNFAATLLTHSITGRVVDGGGAGLAGASVSLTGSQSGSTTTDANGNFAFLSLAGGGNYTITPSLAFYSFSPASQTFSNLSANQVANFTGTRLVYSISGRVTEGAAGLGGVTIALSGGQSASTLTDASGNYSFAGLPAGFNYNIAASSPYFAFTPAVWTVVGLNANQTANFAAARLTYQVSGVVQDACVRPIAGVTMTLTHDGVPATATTNSSGQYSFGGVQAGFNYSLTPTKTGYTFSPVSASFANLNANQSANFIGTPATASADVAATADTYVRGGPSASANFGTATQLITRLGSSATNTYETYLTFNVGQPCTVSSVKLKLFGNLSGTPNNVQVSAYAVSNTAWTETGLTYDNKPAAGALLRTTTVVNTTAAWYEWDVTAYVQSEIAAGRSIISIVLKNPATTSNQVTLNSRQATTNQPKLVVVTP